MTPEEKLSLDNAVEFGRQMFARTKELEARLAASEAEKEGQKKRADYWEGSANVWKRGRDVAIRKREEAERAYQKWLEQLATAFHFHARHHASCAQGFPCACGLAQDRAALRWPCPANYEALLPTPEKKSPLTPEKFDAMAKAMYENEKNQPNPLPYNPLPPEKKSQEKA